LLQPQQVHLPPSASGKSSKDTSSKKLTPQSSPVQPPHFHGEHKSAENSSSQGKLANGVALTGGGSGGFRPTALSESAGSGSSQGSSAAAAAAVASALGAGGSNSGSGSGSEAFVGFEIKVADTGCGISDENLPLLFQPFSQATLSVARKFGGTGLGLSIVKQIVELMGGSIHVTSALYVGTSFTVRFLLPVERGRSGGDGSSAGTSSGATESQGSRDTHTSGESSRGRIPLQPIKYKKGQKGAHPQRSVVTIGGPEPGSPDAGPIGSAGGGGAVAAAASKQSRRPPPRSNHGPPHLTPFTRNRALNTTAEGNGSDADADDDPEDDGSLPPLEPTVGVVAGSGPGHAVKRTSENLLHLANGGNIVSSSGSGGDIGAGSGALGDIELAQMMPSASPVSSRHGAEQHAEGQPSSAASSTTASQQQQQQQHRSPHHQQQLPAPPTPAVASPTTLAPPTPYDSINSATMSSNSSSTSSLLVPAAASSSSSAAAAGAGTTPGTTNGLGMPPVIQRATSGGGGGGGSGGAAATGSVRSPSAGTNEWGSGSFTAIGLPPGNGPSDFAMSLAAAELAASPPLATAAPAASHHRPTLGFGHSHGHGGGQGPAAAAASSLLSAPASSATAGSRRSSESVEGTPKSRSRTVVGSSGPPSTAGTPALDATSSSSLGQPAPIPTATAAAESAPSRSVLVVDDSITNIKILCKMLGAEGYKCSTALDGQLALEVVERRLRGEGEFTGAGGSNTFDIIFSDVLMPRLDGHQFTRALRNLEHRQGLRPVPVVALTANAMEHDKLACFASGMDHFLPKPFARKDLLAVVRKISTAAAAAAAASSSAAPAAAAASAAGNAEAHTAGSAGGDAEQARLKKLTKSMHSA
jgi:CheY-like chemotaxis protein